jgi:Peptidase inhibitor I78 family
MILALLLMTALPASADETVPADFGAGRCHAKPALSLKGLIATPARQRLAMRRAKATTLRVIKPGMMVTMDYRTDRLNIHVNAKNRMTDLSCG